MPVILAQAEMNDWLNGKIDVATAQASLGTHWEGRFDFHRVAPLTQDADGAAVIEPYAPPQASFEF
jgi:putative SOS response-associated peptidase YedK